MYRPVNVTAPVKAGDNEDVCHSILSFTAEFEDQETLFNAALIEQRFLNPVHRKWVAWAAALACRDRSVVALVTAWQGVL